MQWETRWETHPKELADTTIREISELRIRDRPAVVLPRYQNVAHAKTALYAMAKTFPVVLISAGDVPYTREVCRYARSGHVLQRSDGSRAYTLFGLVADGSWSSQDAFSAITLLRTFATQQHRPVLEQPFPLDATARISAGDEQLEHEWRAVAMAYARNGLAIHAHIDTQEQSQINTLLRIADAGIVPATRETALPNMRTVWRGTVREK